LTKMANLVLAARQQHEEAGGPRGGEQLMLERMAELIGELDLLPLLHPGFIREQHVVMRETHRRAAQQHRQGCPDSSHGAVLSESYDFQIHHTERWLCCKHFPRNAPARRAKLRQIGCGTLAGAAAI